MKYAIRPNPSKATALRAITTVRDISDVFCKNEIASRLFDEYHWRQMMSVDVIYFW